MALKPINKFNLPKPEIPSSNEGALTGESFSREIKETAFEQAKEQSQSDASLEQPTLRQSAPISASLDQAMTSSVDVKNENLLKIEAILEEDLADAYFKMTPVQQKKFKVEGEKTAKKIDQLLVKTKDEAKNIFKLILKWLKMMSGVNKFFVEQEAKIKTDKILRLKK